MSSNGAIPTSCDIRRLGRHRTRAVSSEHPGVTRAYDSSIEIAELFIQFGGIAFIDGKR